MAGSFTLTLFRHGLTLENEKKQYLGWTDTSLSQKGQLETKEVADKLNYFRPDKIISSDLIRCQETAALLFVDQSFYRMADFREMHFGVFEVKTYQQLKDQKPYQDWLNSSFEQSPPAGESFEVFSNRVLLGMEKLIDLLEDEDEEIVMVTHGGVIRLLLSKFVRSDNRFFDWEVPNSQGYQLNWENKKSFRRLDKCKSLSVVPSMAKVNG